MSNGHLARSDRTVHGTAPSGAAIARYDVSGKWYLEGDLGRTRVTITEAANAAAEGRHFPGRPGGRLLDARVRVLNEKGTR